MLRTIGRLLWVAISFAISALAALLVLLTLGTERLTEAASRTSEGDLGQLDVWIATYAQLEGAFALLSMLTIVPALLVVIVGEVARIRSAVYWVPAGGAALAAVPFLARFSQDASLALPPATLLQVLATAGFAAGLLYWVLAGRSA